MLSVEQFLESLEKAGPPEGLPPNLRALWFDAKDDWNTAHQIVQETSGKDGDWIHAYLHRKEGDLCNASYWYRRAGRSMPVSSLNEEWREIVDELLLR